MRRRQWHSAQIQAAIAFPDYTGPFGDLDPDDASDEVPWSASMLDPSSPTVFTFKGEDILDQSNPANGTVNEGTSITDWTVTFTPAD